jgi:PAS domain S-box-containing protein
MTPRYSLELKGIQQQVGYYVVMITFIWFGQALRRAREQSDITADNIRREIVERKRAETALRESEARLKLFIEHAPAAIAMFDTTMRYLAVSRQFMKDYGITEDPLGQSHYEQFPELPERWKEVHRRALAGEVLQADADPFIRADGRIQYLKWEARPWQTAGGAIGGILIAIEEVTSRVQAAEALRLSEERLRSILDRAPVAIFIKDPQGRYLFINENAVEALNLDRDKAQGKTDHELLAADLAQQFAEGRRFMSS